MNETNIYDAALRMQAAAIQARDSADRIEAAVQRFAVLLEDGYGGNGVRLIRLLEDLASKKTVDS